MAVITIRGQLGSGAPEIGKLIADKLHIDYVDREIIAKVAELLNRREQEVIAKEMPPGSLLGRVAVALGHTPPVSVNTSIVYGGEYLGASLPTWEIPLDDTRYLAGLKSIITELATSDSIVIRGRGSQFILKNWPGALHALFVSPLKLRVRRVMEDMKIGEESAKKEIARFDNGRRRFIKKYFNAELEDPVHYDLVINTERLSFETAASIIINALQFKS